MVTIRPGNITSLSCSDSDFLPYYWNGSVQPLPPALVLHSGCNITATARPSVGCLRLREPSLMVMEARNIPDSYISRRIHSGRLRHRKTQIPMFLPAEVRRQTPGPFCDASYGLHISRSFLLGTNPIIVAVLQAPSPSRAASKGSVLSPLLPK